MKFPMNKREFSNHTGYNPFSFYRIQLNKLESAYGLE